MTSRQVLRISILITASLLSSADAVVLCAKKSGKVVARGACKSRETTVLPGGVELVGPAGSQGANGAAGPTAQLPQEVVDSTGKQFGTLLQWDGSFAQVVAAVQGIDVPLQFVIVGDKFNNPSPQDLIYYDQSGCTGNAFVSDAGGLVPVAHVHGPRAYFSRTVTSVRTVTSREFTPLTPGNCVSSTPTGRETCCFEQTGPVNASPAESFDTSLLGVTPPFSVVTR